jgi:hypothetical protein
VWKVSFLSFILVKPEIVQTNKKNLSKKEKNKQIALKNKIPTALKLLA